MKEQVYTHVSQGFGAIASAFILDSIALIIPWIITMCMVVVVDLISGMAKSVKIGVKIRFSKFVRDSISKFTAYFGFVVASCMVERAAEWDGLAKNCCLLVILIEAVSIIGNILKMKGYSVDTNKLLALLVSKKFGFDKSEIGDVITKDNERK